MHPFVVPRGRARFAARCGHRVESPLAGVTAEYRQTRANEENALAAPRGCSRAPVEDAIAHEEGPALIREGPIGHLLQQPHPRHVVRVDFGKE
jgi:hypothetical protein